MRGTRPTHANRDCHPGIIPAHAGNTSSARNSDRRTGDHPRACGEHHRLTIFPHRTLGSSPRMRGTRCLRMSLRSIRGIIPAHAGNTHGIGGLRPYRRDHPRACGEHRPSRLLDVVGRGSSPRMRGTLVAVRILSLASGIIPAACGEHRRRFCQQVNERGSSPRMRGTRIADDIARITPGIIPAHAGNTARYCRFA